MIPGIQGYGEQADELIKRYEAVSFEEKHQPELHVLPVSPALILDVGAGTGADAAWFASKGHSVIAVEPTDELREPGKALHPSPAIEWVKDSLPDLALVLARKQQFDAVMLTAVWMHLDREERRRGMPKLNSLLAPGGVLVITLRHGPVPEGRRMFDVGEDETIALAKASGLQSILCTHTESIQDFNRAQHVTWTRLAFRRPA
ncbi:class I SAM-dependent methyltransferase [Microbulbifer sp.]|uniref:class I SAM-dependent methyltransferase n=1 Tax=Microbulbifer sp. TaxID=1908541 RepID=UPI003F32052B